MALANVLRTGIATAVNAGTIVTGANLLASGRSMPAQSSTIEGTTFNGSRIAFVGGNRVVSIAALFTKYQPIWDPRITWAGSAVLKRQAEYWSVTGIAADTFVKSSTDVALTSQPLLTSGVVVGNSQAGSNSWIGKTGLSCVGASLVELLQPRAAQAAP